MAEIHKSAQGLLNECVLLIAQNNELMKLLVHDRIDVNPSTLPIVDKPQQYILQPEKLYKVEDNNFRIYPHCYIPDVIENKRSLICCEIDSVKPMADNFIYAHYYITFYVSCHIDLKVIKGGVRRDLSMCNLMHEMFNRQLSDNSIQRYIHKGSNLFSYNGKWQGYQMKYELMDRANDCK